MALSLTRGIYIVAAKRTPFGTFGGKLKGHSATDLAEIAAKAALVAGNVNPEIIDTVIMGNVIQSSTDAAYVARHVALRCGIPVPVPALTVNRLCGSGFQSIINGAQELMLGEADVALCGGTENMTQAPYALRDSRFGIKLGTDPKLEDTLWGGLTDQHTKLPMGITAENLAEQYGITREMCDAYAVKTQTRWGNANKNGYFNEEMAPVTLKSRKGEQIFAVDEHPRPEATMESLAKLPSVFKKNGTVSAANASGICDGAGAVILATEEACQKHNLKPLARLMGYGVAGCDPKIMGIGPAPAIRKMLAAIGGKLENCDLVEVNEAFAAQYLAVEKELGLNPEITNVNGGGIALGHPLGASGNRITAHLVHELRRRGGKHAIGSACIGGGQGISVMLENV